MKSRLAAAECGVEFCFSVRCWRCEIVYLVLRDCFNFSSAAGIDWVEFGGDYCGIWRWGGWGVCFVGEEVLYELVLEFGGVGVVCEAWEVEMADDHALESRVIESR